MNEKKSIRKRIFGVIQVGNVSDTPSRVFDYLLVAVIFANLLVTFLETFDSLKPYNAVFSWIEGITMGFFCIEYGLRVWTAEYLYPTRKRLSAIGRFIISFDGIVELLTILPMVFLSGAVVFRMLRVVRIFHLFRINATMDSFNVITTVLNDKKNQILSSLFIVIILMLASSLCMYSVEHPVQPDKFQNAFSGMWWSINALLTVGYGDIYPVTPLGKIIAVIISILGVGVVAIPTGIISAGFVEQYTRAQGGEKTFDAQVMTVRVDIDSRWIGKSVMQVRMENGIQVLMMERNGETLQPSSGMVIELGDQLCIFKSKKQTILVTENDGQAGSIWLG